MAQQSLTTYSPVEVTVNWGGWVDITNFAAGTAIVAARSVDNTAPEVGMQGDVALTNVADKTGTIAFTLLQTAQTNSILSKIQNRQDRTNIIRGDLTINDPSGSFLCRGKNAHIMAPPEVALGDAQETREWTFYCEFLEFADELPGVTLDSAVQANLDSIVDGIVNVSDQIQNILSTN